MKAFLIPAFALMACTLGAAPSPVVSPVSTAVKETPSASKVVGDYVEVRTASVFAGACHYNGELVTTGRDAVMAWNFTSGSWKGVDLAGVRAAAAVSSEANLSQEGAARKVELIVDSHATAGQMSAVAALVTEKCGERLGKIVSVRRAPITFTHTTRDYAVKVDHFAAMSVQPMPNNECCAQPNLVWYTPLTPLQNRKVGYTQSAAYTAGSVGDPWQHEGENSAFYGQFAF